MEQYFNIRYEFDKAEVHKSIAQQVKEGKPGYICVADGVVFGKMKYDLLKQCDVFLLPSFYEGLPMSLLETMSFGMVPVVTSVGSIPAVVTDRVNGIFIKVKNIEDIANAIKGLYYDRVKLPKLSLNAQHTILDRFDDRKYIKLLNHLYNG